MHFVKVNECAIKVSHNGALYNEHRRFSFPFKEHNSGRGVYTFKILKEAPREFMKALAPVPHR